MTKRQREILNRIACLADEFRRWGNPKTAFKIGEIDCDHEYTFNQNLRSLRSLIGKGYVENVNGNHYQLTEKGIRVTNF